MTALPRSCVRAVEKWFESPASPSDTSTAGTLVTVDSRGQRAFMLGRQLWITTNAIPDLDGNTFDVQ